MSAAALPPGEIEVKTPDGLTIIELPLWFLLLNLRVAGVAGVADRALGVSLSKASECRYFFDGVEVQGPPADEDEGI